MTVTRSRLNHSPSNCFELCQITLSIADPGGIILKHDIRVCHVVPGLVWKKNTCRVSTCKEAQSFAHEGEFGTAGRHAVKRPHLGAGELPVREENTVNSCDGWKHSTAKRRTVGNPSLATDSVIG